MTLQRVCVSLWVLSTLACSDGVAAPLSGPTPASPPAAAVVLHAAGAVTVTPASGTPFKAAVGQDLVESDLLTPAEGAFAVLGLTNGYLVRIDDVGALRVGQILLLESPRTTRSSAEQLTALLDPGEQVSPAAVEERAAAWRHMRRAGETAGRADVANGAKERSGAGAALESTMDADVGGGGASNSAPALESQEKKQTETAKTSRQRPPTVPKKLADAAPPPAAEQAAPAQPATAAPPPQAPPSEPGVLASLGATPSQLTPIERAPFLSGGIAACLEETVQAHELRRDQVVLFVEVKGGVVGRMRLGGALPVTGCLLPLMKQPVAVADGWVVVRLAP